jgi:hypothetical protein
MAVLAGLDDVPDLKVVQGSATPPRQNAVQPLKSKVVSTGKS